MKEKTSQLCFPMTVSLLTPISFLLCCRMLEFTAAPPSSAVHTTNCINSLFLSGAKKKKKANHLPIETEMLLMGLEVHID